MATKQAERRKARIRRTIKAVAGGRVRLSVFRSSQHIYAQVIDDRKGATLASKSSLGKDIRASLKTCRYQRRQTGSQARRRASCRRRRERRGVRPR